MATAVLLDMLGKIDFNGNTEGTIDMGSLSRPKDQPSVFSGIHYYQLASQPYQFYRTNYTLDTNTLDSGVKQLYNAVQKNGATLVSYFWQEANGSTGHTIVVTKIKKVNDGEYSIDLYDPRKPGKDENSIYIDGEDVIFCDEVVTTLGFYNTSALNTLDYLDIDGTYNNGAVVGTSTSDSGHSVSEDFLNGKAYIRIPAVDFELRNAKCETMVYSNGVVSGNLIPDFIHPIAYGEDSLADLVIIVDESLLFECTFCDSTGEEFFVSSSLFGANISGSGISKVLVRENNIEIDGHDIEAALTFRSDLVDCKYLDVQFQSGGGMMFAYENGCLELNGIEKGYVVKALKNGIDTISTLSENAIENRCVVFTEELRNKDSE